MNSINGHSKNMAGADPAFRAIPKNSVCFHVWRVENMQLVTVPRDQYGIFFTGDSYLIFSASEYGESGGVNIMPRETKKRLDGHIHFWLGKHSSQDEAGVAAYKTVELDDYLGGSPVQHREVQGSESKRFVAYFKNGIRLLNGGVATGFHHVTDEFHARMFSVKGKRKPLLQELPSIEWEHMNDGDVFIIDTQHAIFVWTGKHANKMEKIQAAKVGQALKDEKRGERAILIIEDGEENKLTGNEKQYFNYFLPIGKKQVKSYKEVPSDDFSEKKLQTEIRLYRCSDEEGTLKVTEVKGGPLYQQDLNSQDSYIIDNGESGIWVWVGKKASQKERMEAMRNAQGFSKKKGYAHATSVTRVIDGGEPIEFKSLFRSWKDKEQTNGLGRSNSRNQIAKTIQTKFDVETLHSNHQLAAQTQMVDDGSGKKEVWRVFNFDLTPLDKKSYGTFYAGDSYVILYTYKHGSSENYIIYYWLGSQSTADEKGTAALKTIELDNKYGGKPVQVRVVQGKEPPHFMALFGGKIVILQGGHASGFHNGPDVDSNQCTASILLQVRGLGHNNVKAIQVEMRAASLNSNDVFVLSTPQATYIWCGKGSTGDEREMSRSVASAYSKDPTALYEGQEKNDFWESIGGREEYSSDKRLQEETKDHQPRLFQCSNASGRFSVEEIADFEQSHLIEEDVFLLDCWDSIFIWIGKDSNTDEQKQSEQTALEYLKSDPSHRDLSTTIMRVKQGYEPPNFTGFFGVWDRIMWNNNITYEQLKQQLHDSSPGIMVIMPETNGFHRDDNHADSIQHPLSILLEKDPEKLPSGVNPLMKEIYLNDDEFEQVFEMSKSEFQNLAQWKQINLKKKSGLF